MRPKKHETTGSGDLFRARLDQIINMRHELAQLAGKIDWDFIDGEIAPLYSDSGRPGIATRFVIGLFLLKHIYGLSDEGVCERWVYDPYFQHFTGEEFFQHEFPHERSDLSIGASAWAPSWNFSWPRACAWRMRAERCAPRIRRGSQWIPPCSPRTSPSQPTPSCRLPNRRQVIARGDQGAYPAG
jgi:Transposase domain (DUF772)